MTPDNILTVLQEATGTFGEIAVKPTDNEMARMNRTFLLILLKTPYDQMDITHNLSGLTTPSVNYTKKMARSSISQRAPDPTVPPLPPPGPTPININPKPLIQTTKRTTHYTRRKLW